ncbi:T9SS type A sorting domain-containing protein [Flammeovirga sp. SJP92]|uniref:T9SS type A sorting domain-containing protein n=1 Tax=Flammeovirga sp. SJP92 TaxID=1775430 RepID=UPI0009EE0623|nr:T9SS type A sorting domain-containing protein [Flammeovirga sp. SJP92]
MKLIIYFSILMMSTMGTVFAQDVASITVKCPPCRPIQGCDQCFETQAEADLACTSSSGRSASQNLAEELNELDISVYPNPNRFGKFNVESISNLSGNVKLYSPLGTLISSFEINEKRTFVIGEKEVLPSGIYIMTFTNKEGKTITKRLIVSY